MPLLVIQDVRLVLTCNGKHQVKFPRLIQINGTSNLVQMSSWQLCQVFTWQEMHLYSLTAALICVSGFFAARWVASWHMPLKPNLHDMRTLSNICDCHVYLPGAAQTSTSITNVRYGLHMSVRLLGIEGFKA